MERDQPIEHAARAIQREDGFSGGLSFDEQDERWQDMYRRMASAALDAVEPLIRGAITTRIEARLAEVPARYSDSDEAADGAAFELQAVLACVRGDE